MKSLSSNEWLGDSTTHLMKSGNVIRSSANERLNELAALLPRNPNGSKLEYDITYESRPGAISGYKYTDLLTQALLISPCSSNIQVTTIRECLDLGYTEEGWEVATKLKAGLQDKYILDDLEDEGEDISGIKELVVLPGTNLLTQGQVDFEKVGRLMQQNGVFLKPHPLTARSWETQFRKTYPGKVLPANASLYPLIFQASKVYFNTSSETGLVVGLLGKDFGIIDSPKRKRKPTFEALYSALSNTSFKSNLFGRIAALCSHPETGFLTTHHANPEQRVARFFDHYSKFKHSP